MEGTRHKTELKMALMWIYIWDKYYYIVYPSPLGNAVKGECISCIWGCLC